MANNDGAADFDRVMRNLRKKTASFPSLLAEEVLVSIRDGSSVTGAPGQPRRSGRLIKSWKRDRRGTLYRIYSRLFYAPLAEEGIGRTGKPAVHRSSVGGPHSVKMTRVGLQQLADNLARILEKAGT